MKKNLKNISKDIDKLFDQPPNANQKAWGIINEFYHLILAEMENQNISKAKLAQKLGKSRSAISQMFNKTPNITVRKMVEIADSIGLDLSIIPTELKKEIGTVQEKYVFVLTDPAGYRQDHIPQNDATISPYGIHQRIIAKCSALSKFKPKELH